MAGELSKLKTPAYLIKLVLVATGGGLALMYAADNSATIGSLVEAIAATPIWLILGIELLDKFSDRLDFDKLYKTGDEDVTKGLLMSVLIALLAFGAVLYVLAGTLSFSLGAYTPGVLLASAIYAIYILAPETGDDELILFLWLAATVATKAQYVTLGIPGLTF